MYRDLLAAALEARLEDEDEPTIGEALSELLRCHDRLSRDASSTVDASCASDLVVDQLAYDVALVELAQRMKAHCDVQAFDQPAQARARLEHLLDVGGLSLKESGGHTHQ